MDTKQNAVTESVVETVQTDDRTVNHRDCSQAQVFLWAKTLSEEMTPKETVLVITLLAVFFKLSHLSLDLNTCHVERCTVNVTHELTYITRVQTKKGLLCIHFCTHLSGKTYTTRLSSVLLETVHWQKQPIIWHFHNKHCLTDKIPLPTPTSFNKNDTIV